MVLILKNCESRTNINCLSSQVLSGKSSHMCLVSVKLKGASSPNDCSSDKFFVIQSHTKNITGKQEHGLRQACSRRFWSVCRSHPGVGHEAAGDAVENRCGGRVSQGPPPLGHPRRLGPQEMTAPPKRQPVIQSWAPALLWVLGRCCSSLFLNIYPILRDWDPLMAETTS